jgi:peptidoglycan/LPS O-acetylase OafA/YrhL
MTAMERPGASRDYVPGIDGIRAIAVAAVMIFHMDAFPLWKGGFAGVDLFFVVSGYVISRSLAGTRELELGPYLLGFYRRRILRILPALAAMLLAITLATVLFVPASWLGRSIEGTGLSAYWGCANFRLARDEGGYFSPVTELNPFAHAWSLGVEEQFYLLFPLIFYFQSRKRGGKSTSRAGSIAAALADLAFIALAAASLAFAALESRGRGAAAYYLLPSRFWELAVGTVLFRAHELGRLMPRGSSAASLLIAAGLGLAGAGFVLADRGAFPFPWALPPVIGAVLLICGTVGEGGEKSALRRLLSSPAMTYVGRLSYSLYLWHWPVATLFRWTFGFDSPLSKVLYALLSLALAVASYRLVELPLRRSLLIKERKSLLVIAASLAIVATASLTSWRLWESRSTLSLSVTRDARVWQSGRYSGDGPERPVTGDPRIRGRRLFAIGDSHTAAYRTMLDIVSKRLGIEVYEYEEGDCPVAGLQRPMDERTLAHYEAALREVRRLARPGDAVFLASLRMPSFADQFEATEVGAIARDYLGEEEARNRELALAEARGVIDSFEAAGAIVVLEAPLPVLLAPPYRCSDWFNRMNPVAANGLTVSRAFLEKLRDPTLESMAALGRSDPCLRVWDPFPVLCPGAVFSAYGRDGKPLFWDGDHLSGHGNRVLEPSFEAFLVSLWTGPDSLRAARIGVQ